MPILFIIYNIYLIYQAVSYWFKHIHVWSTFTNRPELSWLLMQFVLKCSTVHTMYYVLLISKGKERCIDCTPWTSHDLTVIFSEFQRTGLARPDSFVGPLQIPFFQILKGVAVVYTSQSKNKHVQAVPNLAREDLWPVGYYTLSWGAWLQNSIYPGK